jgi:hypothetical protein
VVSTLFLRRSKLPRVFPTFRRSPSISRSARVVWWCCIQFAGWLVAALCLAGFGLSSSASAGWGCFFQLDRCLLCLHLFGSLAFGGRLSLSLTWIVGAKAPFMLVAAVCVGSCWYVNRSVLTVDLFASSNGEGPHNTFFFFAIWFCARTRVRWIVYVLCVSLLLFLTTFVVLICLYTCLGVYVVLLGLVYVPPIYCTFSFFLLIYLGCCSRRSAHLWLKKIDIKIELIYSSSR